MGWKEQSREEFEFGSPAPDHHLQPRLYLGFRGKNLVATSIFIAKAAALEAVDKGWMSHHRQSSIVLRQDMTQRPGTGTPLWATTNSDTPRYEAGGIANVP